MKFKKVGIYKLKNSRHFSKMLKKLYGLRMREADISSRSFKFDKNHSHIKYFNPYSDEYGEVVRITTRSFRSTPNNRRLKRINKANND